MAQNLSNDHINLTMLTDFYEITMANGYFTNGFKDTIGYFDMFFRECRTAAVCHYGRRGAARQLLE